MPNIILPVPKVGFKGIVKSIVAIRPDGTKRHLAGPFENLIVDQGQDYIWDSPNYAYGIGYPYARCQVSTSSVPPASGDTQLDTILATTNNVNGVDGGASSRVFVNNAVTISGITYAYVEQSFTYRFSTGAAAGVLAKLAILPYGTGNNIFSATLIKDPSGTPTTVTVLSDEILDVTYSIRMYVRTTDIVTTGVSDGTNTYTVTCRPALLSTTWYGVTDFMVSSASCCMVLCTGALGTVTSSPASQISPSNRYVGWSSGYSLGTYFNDFHDTFGASEYNGNISAVRVDFPNFVHFQYGFSPSIPHALGKLLSMRYRLSTGLFDPTP